MNPAFSPKILKNSENSSFRRWLALLNWPKIAFMGVYKQNVKSWANCSPAVVELKWGVSSAFGPASPAYSVASMLAGPEIPAQQARTDVRQLCIFSSGGAG